MTNIPQPVLDALKNDRLILWVGAGFSQRRLGLPSWRGLVDELADACLPPNQAAELKAKLDNKILTEVHALELLQPHAEKCRHALRQRFDLNIDSWDERLEDFHLLWQISHKIITTNYDTGLDLTRPGSVPRVVHNQKYQRKRLVEGQKFYFKLHGCASEPENCILFEQQYKDLYRDTSETRLDETSDEDTPAKFLLKYLLTGHTVLFVGFGIEERVDFVLEYIHRLLGGGEQPKYTLTHRDNPATWPHTEKWAVGDWADIPGLLRALAEKKAEYNPPAKLGDNAPIFYRDYVGRDADVAAVENFFRGNRNFFFLSGAGGMGKSHLLDTVLQRLPAEQQPIYFRIERHYTRLTLTSKLGIAPVPRAAQGQPNYHLLQAIERTGKTFVFDDFYEIADPELHATLRELPRQRNIKSLLISRSLPPDWADVDSNILHRELIELDRPAFDDCLRGLAEEKSEFPDGLTSGQLDLCWQLCGGYPLGGQLLLSLLNEPDFDPTQLERLDLENDPERKKFIGRLLSAILRIGRDPEQELALQAERNLAREIAVFAEPVPEDAFTRLPSWKTDRIAFFALVRRKGLIFRRKSDNTYGMHALVRSLLLQQLGDSPEARARAGRYYELLSGLSEVEHVVALQKAYEHYELSPETERLTFRARMQQEFVTVGVKQLRDEQDPALTIERFLFRQQLNPGDASAANELGMAYRRQGNLNKAIEVLQKAADAGNIQSANELGITLREVGQFDKAIIVLEKAAEIAPNDIILPNELGITLRKIGHLDKAIEVLQKAVDMGNIQSFNELGITLREAGHLDKAIEVLQKAVDMGNIQSFNELGITFREARRFDKAIEVLQKAAHVGHVPSMNELGITLRETGQLDKSIEVLQQAVDAGNIHSLNELGITLRQAGQLDKSIEILLKAIETGNKHSWNELGITLREAGQLDQAIEILNKALEEKTNNSFVKRNILQIYLFFKPDQNAAKKNLAESNDYLRGISLHIYTQIAEQLGTLLKYNAIELMHYRQYISQIFYYRSWHFAVEYLTGLVQKHPHTEFKAKLGEALCQPVIGRSREGIALLREAMEELHPKLQFRMYWQQTALVLLEVLSHKGKKEFLRNYERLEADLRGYAPFEEKKADWKELLS